MIHFCSLVLITLFCTEIVEFFFVDTTPFVDEYFVDPKDHTYDWEGVLPRMSYLSQLLGVSYNLRIQICCQVIVSGEN